MYVPAGVFGATSTVPSAFTVSGPLVTGTRVMSAGFTATPLSVSLVRTLTTPVPPARPFTGPAASLTASSAVAPTVMVAVAVLQLVGFRISQISYVTVYVPDGVPGATLTSPVAGFSVTFGLVVLTCVSVTVASVAGSPLSVSLTRTFGTATPPAAPLATVPVSFTASITAAPTVTVTVAVSQLVGFRTSQIS